MDLKTRVFHAVSNNNLGLLRNLLEPLPKIEINEIVSTKFNDTTLLLIAAKYGYFRIMQYLIKNGDADIEQTGKVEFDGETIIDAPPLWCAAAAGNINCVKALIKQGANVNSTSRTNSSPLRAACFDGHFHIVKLLVDSGADIEIANKHGHTCLMISCFKGHYSIASYLIDQGCQINRQSIKGNTALHDCAESNNMDILRLLIRNGAAFKRDCFGLTPLMTSAVTGNVEIFDYLKTVFSDQISSEDLVDAYKLLGSTFLDKFYNATTSFQYWERALQLSSKCGKQYHDSLINNDKSFLEAYGNTREFQNNDDLKNLQSDPDKMKMQSLIIRERILGIHHPETYYFIRLRGATYADAGDYSRCIALWMYNLERQQKISKPLSDIIQNSFISMIDLFILMLSKNSGIRFCDIFRVLKSAIEEILSSCDISTDHKKSGKVYQILERKLDIKYERYAMFKADINGLDRQFLVVIHLIGFICKLRPTMSSEEWREFRQTVYHFVKIEPRSSCSYSLLHILCILSSNDKLLLNFELPKYDLRDIFTLVVGVSPNLNIVDIYGNTPLHILLEQKDIDVHMVAYLINSGAHFDICNEIGVTPLDLVRGKPVENTYRMRHISLQCMCAHVIAKKAISFDGLPRNLRQFISLHQRKSQ